MIFDYFWDAAIGLMGVFWRYWLALSGNVMDLKVF